MGTFFHPITLIGPEGQRDTLEAVVDTGAAYTTIPRPILERLGVRPHRSVRLRLADGHVVDWQLGRVLAQLDGLEEETLCVFGTTDAPPLIGAYTLEGFALGVDPTGQRLVPREMFLLAATIGWWIYENWQADPGGKARVHQANCGFCNNGQGTGRGTPGLHGKWHGPFTSRAAADNYAHSLGRALVDACRVCC